MVELTTIIRESVIEVPVSGGSLAVLALAAATRSEAAADAAELAQAAAQAAQVAAEVARAAAEAASSAAAAYATAASSSAAAAEVSRLAAVAARTGAEAAQTAAAASAAAALASKLAADADAAATAADRVQTGLDRTAASASATAAAASVPVTADRVVGYRANSPAIWTTTRATPAYVRNAAGVLVPVAADTMAMAFDGTTLAPRGPAFAGARTNLFSNPRFEGAAVGVIGSGGALPTGCSIGTPVAGVTYSVAAFGYLPNGDPYCDVTYAGTLGASGPLRFLAGIPSGIVFAASEVLTVGLGYQLIAGSMAGFSGTYTQRATGITSSTPAVAAPSATANRTLRTFSAVGGTTGGNAGQEYLWGANSGSTVNATIRYYLPNFQRGAFLGSIPLPPVGSPSSFTEAQTSADIDVTKLGANWNYRQGTIIIDWSSRPGPFTSANDADWFGLVSWGDKTANERMGLLLNPAHTLIEARVTAGGVVQTAASRALTAPAADVTTRSALAWDLDAAKLQVAARGAVGTAVTLSALPVPGWLMPGRYGTSHPGFVCIPGLEVRPAAIFDAALAALT